jgi:hypothetical protein
VNLPNKLNYKALTPPDHTLRPMNTKTPSPTAGPIHVEVCNQVTKQFVKFYSVYIPIKLYLMQLITSLRKTEDYSLHKSQRDALSLNFILIKNSICFGQIYCPSSGVLMYSQQLVKKVNQSRYRPGVAQRVPGS